MNCHQPAWGMSVSASGLPERWHTTDGKDPVFAAFDGSNCPNLPQDKESSHSLLLKRGLFRIPLRVAAEECRRLAQTRRVHDRSGARPHRMQHQPRIRSQERPTDVSVYRRPRPAANLKYVVSGGTPIVLKTGMLADVDPESGKPVSMNLMSDAREATLKTQAMSAIWGTSRRGFPDAPAD